MPAWPGGKCPDCGDLMPPNLITCQTCRALLNSDLQIHMVDIPGHFELREISPEELESTDSAATAKPESKPIAVPPRGIYFECPACQEELKVPRQYIGSNVLCNRCNHGFKLVVDRFFRGVKATYVNCPHCSKRIRASVEMTNQKVECNHCQGELKIEYRPDAESASKASHPG